jgi:hypothetical protein
MFFDFLYKFCLKISYFETNLDIFVNAQTPSRKVPVILVRFEQHLNFLDIFSKNTHIKFHSNLSPGRSVVPCGRTDIHYEVYIRFLAILLERLNMVYLPGIEHGLLGVPDRSLIIVPTDISSSLRAKSCR